MKILRIITIVIFAAVILLPLCFLNTAPEAVSEIDNRKLAENPFTTESGTGDLTKDIENYVNDRIGFRNEIIRSYTVLNDRIFGKMVHPSYTYGKDKYVFGAGVSTENNFGEFHIAFADMVKEIQDYCEAREIPFLFVFNPAKPAVYTDKISDGVNYNREWVDDFFAELDRRGVNYLDNTVTLRELREAGTEGFNPKYDANHWNDVGAFYGTKAMLEKLQEISPDVHVNERSEFVEGEVIETSLLSSEFPIEEVVPSWTPRMEYTAVEDYHELELHPSYPAFGYYRNERRLAEGCPKALVFQGSYMNGKGTKYFINSFGEYVYVHDYQNVIDFPYYFNIFRPDCVIFEVAEYVFAEGYFNLENMKAVDYNPVLEETEHKEADVIPEALTVEKGEVLTKIFWKTEESYDYVWMTLAETYDMKAAEGGYTATVLTEELDQMPKIYVTE